MRAKRRQQMRYQNGPNAEKKPAIKKAWEKPNSLLAALLKDYFKTCSLHGLRYITEESYHWSERCLWAVLSVLALYGVSYGCSVIWEQFQTSPTNTALESTNYAIMNIPFPSVTICTKNHVYWDKVIDFQKQNLSNASNDTIEKFHLLMTAFSTMTFGDFDMLSNLIAKNTYMGDLEHLNIPELMIQVMPRCKELFVDPCWWRNMDYNCCDLFELQRTEEGFCYSFNSEISNAQVKRASGFNWSIKGAEEVPKSTSSKTLRPRRTSNSGEWSGLRAEIKLSPEQIPPLMKGQLPSSLQISVNNPYGFPAASETIHVASIGQVSVSANVMHATSRVRTMSVVNRRCLYHDERSALGMHTYNEQNCIGECHLNHSVQYCNCSPYFYPTRDSIKSCDVIGYMCLAAFNEVFNYVKPAENNPYFDNSTLGMVCDCMPDCHSVDYISEIYTTDYGSKINFSKEKNAFVDVHFKQPTSVMYRTDIVFGWLELMVSLGGLAGLFLGCSMLSAVELLYFFTIRLFFVWSATRCRDNPQRRKAKKGAYLTPPTNKNTVLNESQAYFI